MFQTVLRSPRAPWTNSYFTNTKIVLFSPRARVHIHTHARVYVYYISHCITVNTSGNLKFNENHRLSSPVITFKFIAVRRYTAYVPIREYCTHKYLILISDRDVRVDHRDVSFSNIWYIYFRTRNEPPVSGGATAASRSMSKRHPRRRPKRFRANVKRISRERRRVIARGSRNRSFPSETNRR